MATLREFGMTLGRIISSQWRNSLQIPLVITRSVTDRTSLCTVSSHAVSFLRLQGPQATASLHTSAECRFHSTQPVQDLMEFFSPKDDWGEKTVVTGRPWRVDELRIKSNQDLHKLWYILLKERNRLLTMEAEYIRNTELFPNPERIDKVEESMENILQVVSERDNAVSLLETGRPTRPEGGYVRDFLGRVLYRKYQEYAVPPHVNKVYRLLYPRTFRKENIKYLALYREKIAKHKWYHYNRRLKENRKLVDKFPHLEGKIHVQQPNEPKIN